MKLSLNTGDTMKRIALVLMTMTLAACGDKESCEVGVLQCSGDVLQECSADEAWETSEDCAESGMMCHSEGEAHCMEMGDDMDDMDDTGEMEGMES
jgi:hypothetical protein